MKLHLYGHPQDPQHIYLCWRATGGCIVQAATGTERKKAACVTLFQILHDCKCENTSTNQPKEKTAAPAGEYGME